MAMMTVYNPIAPQGRSLAGHLASTTTYGLASVGATAGIGAVIDWGLERAGLDLHTWFGAASGFVGRGVVTAGVIAASSFVRDDLDRTAMQGGALAAFLAPYVAKGLAFVRAWFHERNGQQGPTEPVGGYTASDLGGRPDPMPAMTRPRHRQPALGAEYLHAVGADIGSYATQTHDDSAFVL